MFGITGHQKPNIDSLLKTYKKEAVKHSQEKPTSFNFVNLPTILRL